MKYLKYFKQSANYQQFKETEEYILPNVSYVENDNVVYYNPYVEQETRLVCTYNVTNTTSATKVCYQTSNFASMEVDGVLLDSVTTGYTFDTVGEHTVKFELANPTTIEFNAFRNCSGLTSITIPDSVTSIGNNAFGGCSGLTSVVIPDSVTSIGNNAFSSCRKLTGELIIPDSVTSIGSSAFSNCSGLTEVHIGSGVTSIGKSAFDGCSGLTGELIIPDSVTSIGQEAFNGCSGLTSVVIPDSVTSIGNNAFGYCKSLTSIVVSEGNTVYDSRENCNCIIETATNRLIQGCNNSFIPDSVTSIGNSAFGYCKSLTSITIPDSVTSIEGFAFDGCSGLTSITCNAITAPIITSYAFQGVKEAGILKVPTGSDYITWMSTDKYYLGYYNWTIEYI